MERYKKATSLVCWWVYLCGLVRARGRRVARIARPVLLNTFRVPYACPHAASSTSSALKGKSNDDGDCELNTTLGCPSPSRPPTKGPASAHRARSAVLMNSLCCPPAHRAFTTDRPLDRTQSRKERCSLRWPFAPLRRLALASYL